jgi:hypothetical protein
VSKRHPIVSVLSSLVLVIMLFAALANSSRADGGTPTAETPTVTPDPGQITATFSSADCLGNVVIDYENTTSTDAQGTVGTNLGNHQGASVSFALPVGTASVSAVLDFRGITPPTTLIYTLSVGNGNGDTFADSITVNCPVASPTTTATEVTTGTPTEMPTDVATNTPSETPTDVASNTPTEMPTDVATSTPSETPTGGATDTPTEVPSAPTDVATSVPTEPSNGGNDDGHGNHQDSGGSVVVTTPPTDGNASVSAMPNTGSGPIGSKSSAGFGIMGLLMMLAVATSIKARKTRRR